MIPTKKAISSGLAALGVVIGAASLSVAASPSPAPVDGPAAESTTDANDGPDNEVNDGPDNATDGQDEPPTYTSSVTAPEAAEGVSDTAERAALAPLAKVTTDEAIAAATASHPGTVVSTQLENENGNVVYSVVIDTGSRQVDVKVDAGDATVLASEPDDGEGDRAESDHGEGDHGAADANETPDPPDATTRAGG